MKAITRTQFVVLLSFSSILFAAVAYAAPQTMVRIGSPQDGIYTDVALEIPVGKAHLLFNALEASLSGMEKGYSYVGCELGLRFGEFTPFIVIARATESDYWIDSSADQNVQKLVSEAGATCYGAGISGQYGIGKVVIDGSYRAFNREGTLNSLSKAALKYRVATNSFLTVGYNRWDDEAEIFFDGINFGLQIGW